MDIEGGEYEILSDIIEAGIEIRQILVEFHHWMYKKRSRLTQNAVKLLRATDYEIFAVLDSSEEVSFIKVNQ